jgi:hypothetical protein
MPVCLRKTRLKEETEPNPAARAIVKNPLLAIPKEMGCNGNAFAGEPLGIGDAKRAAEELSEPLRRDSHSGGDTRRAQIRISDLLFDVSHRPAKDDGQGHPERGARMGGVLSD